MEPEYILVKSKSHNDEAEMGEQQTILFQADFNRAARVEPSPTPISEDAGAIALREVSEALGLPALLAGITDLRDPERITHPLQELLFSRIFLLAQGWQDQDDADVLRPDPALRLAVSSRAGDGPVRPPQKPRQPGGLASQPTLSRLNHALAHPDNIAVLQDALLRCAINRIRRVHGRLARLVVDIDSFPIEAHGNQPGSRYNGHYRRICTHPLIAFTDTGDIVGVLLRPGNVHTAADVQGFLEPIIAALREVCDELLIRVDSGFAGASFFAYLANRGVKVITRLPVNDRLRQKADDWATEVKAGWRSDAQPDGRPREALLPFAHAATTWAAEKRVVAVVLERNTRRSELLHNEFFIATDLGDELGPDAILALYRQRGTAEGHIGELKRVLAPRLSSSARRPRRPPPDGEPPARPIGINDNAVVLLLSAIAYNLMHALRCGIEEAIGAGLSLDRLRERVLKTACVVVRHAREVIFKVCPSKAAWWRAVSVAVHGLRQPCEVAA